MARLKEPSQLQVVFSSESSCAAAAPTVAAVASGRAGQSSGQRAGQEAIMALSHSHNTFEIVLVLIQRLICVIDVLSCCGRRLPFLASYFAGTG